MNDFIIFGASNLGKIAHEHIIKTGGSVSAFCDNDAQKCGGTFLGIKVIAPTDIIAAKKTIIIASSYHIFIAKQLIEMGVKNFGCFYIKNYDTPTIAYFDYAHIEDFPENKKKILFISETFSGSNINAIYDYMKLKKPDDIDIALINENERENDYYYNILTSKVIVKAYAGSNLEGKIIIQLWHSFLLKGLGFMGRFGAQSREYEHQQWANLSKIISYSSLYNTLMSACYGIQWDKFSVTGMPRNDILFTADGKSYLKTIYGVEKEKAIIYMPTYRETVFGQKNGNASGYFYNAQDFDAGKLNAFLSENSYKLFIKLHQTSSDQIPESLRQQSNIIVIDNQYYERERLDFYNVLNGFDLLITDYSGVFFDYLLLDRPMVFTPLDLDEYIENKGLLLEPYDKFTPGPKATSFEDLMAEIKKSLADEEYFKHERAFVKSIAHKYWDGNSSGRVADVIVGCVQNSSS